MATHTTYYNLTKPAQNDKVNIGVLNDNADIIDTALHNKVDSDDLTANNVMMSDGETSVEDALDVLQIESGTFNVTSGSFIDSTVNYKKQGNVVTIFFNLKASAAINSSTVIGAVPVGLKPPYPVSVKSAEGGYGLYLYENGNILTLGSINASAWVYATLTYIV